MLKRSLFGAAVYLFLPVAVFGQTYSPGPASTVGNIQSQTVNTMPLPLSRTTIGIGESVNCWIDPSTWYDTDYEWTSSGWVPVQDTMGTITWSIGGPGTIYPTTGDSVTVTADLADSDGNISVTASVPDSGTMGLDMPIPLAFGLLALIPRGVNATYNRDVALGVLAPPNIKQIGAKTIFDMQVLPNTVNFKGVSFRENIPLNKWTWNDTTKDTFGPQVVPYNVADKGGTPNWSTDTCSTGLDPVGRLAGKNQTVTWSVPQEYQDVVGGWNQFIGETHDNAYDGTKFTCTITENVTNKASGTAQGPWQ